MDRLAELYDAVWTAGEAFGIADFGVYAVNSLRMEKAYKGWGAELTNEITMIEADMERFVDYTKEDFIGKTATQNVKQAGIVTQLVYVEMEPGTSDVHGGEPVLVDGRAVGVTTSGGHGHHTGKSLGFAYVEPAFAETGSRFQIELLGEPRTATVLAEPVYDPANERLRA
jgi:dimethylglycine dehydrogenase